MSYDLSAFLKSINFQKNHLLTDPEANLPPEDIEKQYPPFVVNRCLSYFPDTLMHAQEMNLRGFLDKRLQYEYLLYSVRKRRRFAPWQKKESPEDLATIKDYYGFNNAKALEALKILTDSDIELMRARMQTGGLKNKRKK